MTSKRVVWIEILPGTSSLGLFVDLQIKPTFFINGVRHDDSYALETLLAAIEAAMPSS